MVAFIANGTFSGYDEAISSMVHEKDIFYPRAEEHKIYMELYNGAYRRIFGKLEPLYKKIIKINKRRETV